MARKKISHMGGKKHKVRKGRHHKGGHKKLSVKA
jgi:hypothetical protein